MSNQKRLEEYLIGNEEKKVVGYLKDTLSNGKVIMLSGKWGSGKTHFWKEIIEKNLKKEIPNNYISLYGKTSIQEIKNEVFLKIFESMDIFKIDEVKKYVEMRNERVMEDASKMMMNNQKFKEMSDHLIKTTTEPIQEFYKKTINDRHIELLNVVSQVIISLEPDKREKFIKEVLPNNQQALMDMLIDHEKNKT